MHLKGNRTAIECRLKWTNQVHPDLKTGGAGKVTWTPDETKKLERFTRKYGECGAWREIAAGVGARTALQCFQKWRKIKFGILALTVVFQDKAARLVALFQKKRPYSEQA